MSAIPLMIDLAGKHVIVVGGGSVAERRIRIVLESGANVTVICPDIKKGIQDLWIEGYVNWRQKAVEASDLEEAFFVIVATSDAMVNQSIGYRAPTNTLINDVTDADRGNTMFPSFFRRGRLSVSVSTNGASPMLSAKLNRDLQTIYDDSYTDYVEFLYECRQQLKKTTLPKHEQQIVLKKILSETYMMKENQTIMREWLARLTAGE